MQTKSFNELKEVVEYLYHDEYKHYHETPEKDRDNHIFNQVKHLQEYVDGESSDD